MDRVIVLYIYETFPDIETNGVDIYGGWEGADGQADVRDTADPVVIARYWLIRFAATIIVCCSSLKVFFCLCMCFLTRFLTIFYEILHFFQLSDGWLLFLLQPITI